MENQEKPIERTQILFILALLGMILLTPVQVAGQAPQVDPTSAFRSRPGVSLDTTQGAEELVADGSFEGGTPNAAWEESSTNFSTPICDAVTCGGSVGSGPHTGSFWVWFGGIDGSEEAFVRQDVTIPAGFTTLSFWLEMPRASGTGNDRMRVSMDGQSLLDVTDADQAAYDTYTQVILDVSSYADGGTHTLSLEASCFGGGITDFFVDDVALVSCPDFAESDYQVAAADVQAVAGAWRTADPAYDCDGDGVITVTDVVCVAKRFGEICGPAGPPGIFGRMTHNGAPAPNLEMTLRVWDAVAGWLPQATTTTGPQGFYDFVGIPSLAAGQEYSASYGPNLVDSDYLFAWYGPTIPTYAGEDVPGGDFDVANVYLASPTPNSSRQLPVTFEWQRRGLAGETYRLGLLRLPDESLVWLSDDLGDVGSFTLASLPPGIQYNQLYGWYVEVYNGPDSFGVSYYYRQITFLP